MNKQLRGMFAAVCWLSLLASAPCSALVISATNSSQVVVDPDIPDSAATSSATRTVTFGAGDLGGALNSILDVNITIDFMKCDNRLSTPLPTAAEGCLDSDRAFAGEIIFQLTSPGGTQLSLIEEGTYTLPPDGNGPIPGARIVVTFDDAAATLVGGTDFVSGTFGPIGGPLSVFNGEGAIGNWTLHIEDAVAGDPLGFASFKLDITLADPPTNGEVPEPGTALLLGLGLAGFAALRRRRS